jgi:16S rRNA (cytosine967-C5)-methyltransferase
VAAAARRATAARLRDRVSPARACAYAVIRRVFEQGAFADRALHSEAAGLDHRDRALATQLAYGTVQRRATLDFVAERLSSRPPSKLEAPVLTALRLGLFQLLFLDRIADHAAVNDSVELAKLESRGGAGLVNAVLRRAAREGASLLAGLSDEDPEHAAVLHSLPQTLARRWWDELGGESARALMARVNEPAEAALRVNTLLASVADVTEALPVPSTPAHRIPEGLVLDGPFDAHGSPLFEDGAIMPQSRGSMLVAQILGPAPGARVLDLCAAPGAKTTQLAALMHDQGELVAVEGHAGRAKALERTCRRMHASCVEVQVGDAAQRTDEQRYDRVLVDPPCSGLGTLQSRPDLRWRVTPEAIAELAVLQRRILEAAGDATAPGGELVYSVCTISQAESGAVIDAFLAAHPEFRAIDLQAEYQDWRAPSADFHLQLLPHRDGTDGFFIAALRRAV